MTVNTRSLRILNVSGCKVITDEHLKSVVASNKFLHTIDLSRCHHLTSESLHTIASNCKQLLRCVDLLLKHCHCAFLVKPTLNHGFVPD